MTVLLECTNERYEVYYNVYTYMMTVLLEYIDRSVQFSTNT